MVCDLCGGHPACVTRCETRAIYLIPVKWNDKTSDTQPSPVTAVVNVGDVNLDAVLRRFAHAKREAKKVVREWKAEGIIDV
jgi:hypothetical protein